MKPLQVQKVSRGASNFDALELEKNLGGLKDLFDRGVISEAEYKLARKNALGI